LQMHHDFAGALGPACDLVTLHIDDDQIVTGHHALTHTRWRRQNAFGVQTDRDIAVVGRYPALLKNQATDLTDVLSVLSLRLNHSGSSIVTERLVKVRKQPIARMEGARMAEDPRRMCPHCRAFITTKDKVCPYCNERVGPRAYQPDPSGMLAGFIPQARYTTVLILFINVAFYIATGIYSTRGGQGSLMNIDGETLVNFGAAFSPYVFAGQWWRLVTAGFLHGGLLHILFNSWAMFDVGAQVDQIYGTPRMLVIYFVATVTGFLTSVMTRPVLAVGASAALCGLIGAMVAAGLRDRSAFGAVIRGAYIRWFVWILVFSLMPGVDMAAHIGGFVGGFAIAWVAGAGETRYASPWTNRLWQLCAVFCVILTACCFLKMYLSFSQFGG